MTSATSAARPTTADVRDGWGASHYGGGLLSLILIVVLVLWITGNVGSGGMMR